MRLSCLPVTLLRNHFLRKTITGVTTETTEITHKSLSTEICQSKSPCKIAYKAIINEKKEVPLNSQTKWLHDLLPHTTSPEVNWKYVYLMPFQTTKSTKLIVFRYKLSHRRLTTNTFLYKVLKLKENDKCTYCQTYKEDLIHHFWSCKYTAIFWTLLKLWLIDRKILHKDHNFSIEVPLGLRPDTSKNMHQINFCLLLARYFLWCCRTTEKLPKFEHYLHQLKF